ncbi:MAG TPA: hypothetical protein VN887_09265 [Candidatus Angelobacter sp.]|nr:hypothetical protein [Candidatus Angelobacter sp.]
MNTSEMERTTHEASRAQSRLSTGTGWPTNAAQRDTTTVERGSWASAQSSLPPAVRMRYDAPTPIRWGINE